jgi:hypothetical protein
MSDDSHLVSFLASNDAPCPVCSYNLRALTTDTCPECAAKLHLQVGSENLRLGPWLLGLAGPMLGLGFDGVMALITLGERVFQPPNSPFMQVLLVKLSVIFAAMAAACGFGLLFMIRRRRGWMLLSLKQQKRWGAGIFLAVGIIHAIVGAIMARMY